MLTGNLSGLSMDSERGKELYKFDRSLMERLSDTGLPMSQINTQRRMRPSISSHIRCVSGHSDAQLDTDTLFIRTILYPRLEAGD